MKAFWFLRSFCSQRAAGTLDLLKTLRILSVLLVYWICYHFVGIWSCVFRFLGVVGVILKRTNPGFIISRAGPMSVPPTPVPRGNVEPIRIENK